MELQKYEQEHLDILRPLLPECTVLLKKNGDFPLGKPGKIALYGNGVRKTVKGGTGSGEVNSRFFETVEDGFQKAGFAKLCTYKNANTSSLSLGVNFNVSLLIWFCHASLCSLVVFSSSFICFM